MTSMTMKSMNFFFTESLLVLSIFSPQFVNWVHFGLQIFNLWSGEGALKLLVAVQLLQTALFINNDCIKSTAKLAASGWLHTKSYEQVNSDYARCNSMIPEFFYMHKIALNFISKLFSTCYNLMYILVLSTM